MPELKNLQMPELIDLLAAETIKYTKLIIEGGSLEEFVRLKLTIRAVQSEIATRKKSADENASADFI